jgi:predicted MFS family arabinose efflux permease
VYAIIEAPNHGWTSPETIAWFTGAAVALVLWGLWEWRTRHPMLDLKLFRNPRFAVASGGITLVFFAMFGMFFLLTQYLQGVLDYSPLGAAVRLLPISAVMMFVAPQTPKLVGRFGANTIGTVGLLVVAVAMGGVAMLDTDTSYWQLIVTMMVMAGGMALTMTPMTTQLMMAVPLNRAGMGSATNDTTRELGGALGVAVLGSLLAGRYGAGMADAVAGLPAQIQSIAEGSLGGVHGLIAQGALPEDTPLLGQAKQSFVDGLSLAATVSAVAVALGALAVKRFLPADRHRPEMTGAERPAAPASVAGD